MSRIKANRLFSFLALFSIVFNNILTPLSVYAEDVQENPQQQESVVSEPTPATEETQPDVEITPTETITPTPTVEETITPTPEITTEASQETNEGAQSQAPPTTDTPTPTPSVEISAPQGDEKLQVNIVEDVQAVSIDYMDIQYNPDGTASIKTDKLDYAPTDVVVITGTGFEANIEYEIKITGSYNFESFGRAMSNDAGNILYSIQLDGTPRPNYRAEVLRNGMLYASVDFTDSESSTAEIPFSDSFGSSNQNNVTNWDDSDGNSSNARIEGSSTSRPGSPTTGHLRISNNSWVCRTINTSGFSSIQLKYYWRGDRDAGASDNGYSEYKIGGNCSDNSGWEEIRKDDLDSNTKGWSNQQTFSFPSSVNNQIIHIRFRGASDDSNEEYRVDDVSVTGVAATSIQVTSVNGNQPPFDFSCQTNPLSNPVSLTGNGTGTTPPGQIQQYHVLIDWGDGTVDTNLGTFTPNSGQGNFTYTFSGGPHSYTVAGDYVITVKLYHSQAPGQDNQIDATTTLSMCIPPTKGSITITKDVVPDDSSVWDFTVTGTGVNLSKNDLGDGQSYKFENLNPGSYNITEITDSRYVTTVKCGDSGPLTQNGFLGSVVAGQDLKCTFTNTLKPVTFVINKYIDQDGDLENTTGDRSDGTGWTFQVYKEGAVPQLMATGTTDSTGQISMPPFYPESGKTYKVIEQAQTGYSFISAKCGIGAETRGQVGTDSVNSVIANPGENIVCDFYNKPATGVLKITKDSRPNDTQNFLFTVRDSQGNIVGNAELDDWSGSSSTPDNKSFTLNAGTYYITETAKDGSSEWKMTDVICRDDAGSLVQSGISPDGKVNVDVFSGQKTNCTFVNTKYGGVYGEKFNDKNGNNIDDSGEEDLRGWRIYVDLDEDGKYDSGEPTDVTDSGGDYSIGGLLPGEYSICEVQQDGWYSSLPNNALCQKTTIHSDGGDWDPVNFGNHGIVTIKAYKIVCPMEASLPNWGYGPYGSIDGGTADWFLSHHTGCYYQDNWEFQWGYGGRGGVSSVPGDHIGYAPKTGDDYDEWKNFNTATDNHHGSQYSAKAFISDLKGASSIWVREVLPSDEWLPFSDDTSWPRDNDVSAEMYCSGDILNYDNYDEIDNPLYGQSYYCIAFNTLNKGKITGVKWEDIDGDMHYERGENTIAGWNITATDSQGHSYSASTNASGEYAFDNLMPGEYVVCEENQRGYIQTFPSGQSCHTVTVIGGRTESGNNFGNMPVNLDLEIEKTNVLNSSNATVDYTIKVTNTGNMNYNSYEIHDALPGGFNYLAGSSYLNDNPIDDPVFNSGEAMWEIEEGLTIGETAILTYRASIDSSLPAGFYTNFAYAVGVFNYPWDNPEPSVFERAMVIDDSDDYTHEEPIIIRVSDTATTEIVDSQVELLSSVSYGGKLTGQVLGASTDVLPATGSETWVIMLATAFVIIGFVTKGAAIMIERKRKNE